MVRWTKNNEMYIGITYWNSSRENAYTIIGNLFKDIRSKQTGEKPIRVVTRSILSENPKEYYYKALLQLTSTKKFFFELHSIFGGNINYHEIENIIQNTDGLIFVFDGRISNFNENIIALNNLIKISKGKLIKRIPLVIMLNFVDNENSVSENLVRSILKLARLWYERENAYFNWNPTIYETCTIYNKYKNIHRSFSECSRRISIYWLSGYGGAPIQGDPTKYISKELTEQLIQEFDSIINPDDVRKIVKQSMDAIEKQKKLKNIIEKGESETVEFKATFKFDLQKKEPNKELPIEVSKAICAFLNSRGGTLFIGIANDKRILGLENDLKIFKDADVLMQEISGTIRRNIGGIGLDIEMNYEVLNNKKICIINVAPSNEAVFHLNNQFYVRRGTSSHSLNPKESNDYVKNHFKDIEDINKKS